MSSSRNNPTNGGQMRGSHQQHPIYPYYAGQRTGHPPAHTGQPRSNGITGPGTSQNGVQTAHHYATPQGPRSNASNTLRPPAMPIPIPQRASARPDSRSLPAERASNLAGEDFRRGTNVAMTWPVSRLGSARSYGSPALYTPPRPSPHPRWPQDRRPNDRLAFREIGSWANDAHNQRPRAGEIDDEDLR